MSSSKDWALYASNRRLGTGHEHRMSGARMRQVGVGLDWTPMHGWKATVYVGRFAIQATWKPHKNDPRAKAWFDAIMGRLDTNSGLADARDGRLYEGIDDRLSGPSRPSASWSPDDPQKPIGWHHDGQRWVQNDDGGWWRDRSGYWRYNRPGDPGWEERPDGSWNYVSAPTPGTR